MRSSPSMSSYHTPELAQSRINVQAKDEPSNTNLRLLHWRLSSTYRPVSQLLDSLVYLPTPEMRSFQQSPQMPCTLSMGIIRTTWKSQGEIAMALADANNLCASGQTLFWIGMLPVQRPLTTFHGHSLPQIYLHLRHENG